MASARNFDAELAALESLRDADPASTEAPLRKALTHRNNFIVAKAAKLTALHNHHALTEDLVTAFPRFLINPVKSDPQCWAKNAIAQTFAAFEYLFTLMSEGNPTAREALESTAPSSATLDVSATSTVAPQRKDCLLHHGCSHHVFS